MGKQRPEPKKTPRHDPLLVQLKDDELGSGKLSALGRRQKRIKSDVEPNREIDNKTSKKILSIAKEQQQEMLQVEQEQGSILSPEHGESAKSEVMSRQRAVDLDFDSDDEFEDPAFDMDDDPDGDGSFEEIDVDEGDQAILDSFRSDPTRNLANLILQKIEEQEDQQQTSDTKGKSRRFSDAPSDYE